MSHQAMTEVTLENAAFKYSEVGEKEYQSLIDVAQGHMHVTWKNADQYMRFTRDPDQHVTWFDEEEGFDGRDGGPSVGQVIVPFEVFFKLYCEHFGEVPNNLDEVPVRNPRPRFRKRNRQKRNAAKTIARVIYKDQKTYTFKNLLSIQIIDGKVYIQHEKDVAEGIKESVETEIDVELVMAVVIHEVGNRATFFQNITGTWDFHNDDGTVIVSAQQLGRVFKK